MRLDLKESSNVECAFWHSKTSKLFVKFKKVASYYEYEVTQVLIDEWITAESVGSYFSKFIKRDGKEAREFVKHEQYPYEEVRDVV